MHTAETFFLHDGIPLPIDQGRRLLGSSGTGSQSQSSEPRAYPWGIDSAVDDGLPECDLLPG